MLEVYQNVILSCIVLMDGSSEQSELQLTGLVVKEGAYLKIANKIYSEIFRPWWIERRLTSLCPYQTMLDKWLTSNCDARWLLTKESLQEARAWAGNQSLSEEHHQFLMHSQSHIYEQEMAKQEAARKQDKKQMMREADAIATRRTAKLRQQLTLSLILCGLLLIVVIILIFLLATR